MAGRAPPREGTPRPKQTRAPQPPHTANSALPKAGPEAGPTQRSPLPGAQRHGIPASRKPSAPQRPNTRPHRLRQRQCVEVNQQAGPHGWQKSRRAMAQRRRKTGQKPAVSQGDVRPGAPEGDGGGPGPAADRTDAKNEPLFRRFTQIGQKKSCRARRKLRRGRRCRGWWPGSASPLGHAPRSRITVLMTGEAEILCLGRTVG